MKSSGLGRIGVIVVAAWATIITATFAAGPTPGYYRIRGLESGRCVGVDPAAGLEVAHLVLRDCADTRAPFYNYFAIIPSRWDLSPFTIRPYSMRGPVATRLSYCVTRTRGAVIGPRRADILPCSFPEHVADWCRAGIEDQTFLIFTQNGNSARPAYLLSLTINGLLPQELDVRNHGTDIGTDLVLWDATGAANQTFELLFDRPLDTADDLACASPLPRPPQH